MTERIPDAPYIVEAERKGLPPYGDAPDYSQQAALLYRAERLLEDAVDWLLDAEDALEGSEFADDFRELIHTVENAGCDIRSERRRICKDWR